MRVVCTVVTVAPGNDPALRGQCVSRVRVSLKQHDSARALPVAVLPFLVGGVALMDVLPSGA